MRAVFAMSAVTLSLNWSGVAAADLTAYGFEFNKPLALSECPRLAVKGPANMTMYSTVKEPCLQSIFGSLEKDPPSGMIAFPFGQGVPNSYNGPLLNSEWVIWRHVEHRIEEPR
jgi:hypothetical protein